jgi:hypothetical protein
MIEGVAKFPAAFSSYLKLLLFLNICRQFGEQNFKYFKYQPKRSHQVAVTVHHHCALQTRT